MVRKILRRIRISELSTVNNPAQEGALAVLIKSENGAEESPADVFAKAAAIAAMTAEKRLEAMDGVDDAVEAIAKGMKAPGESIEQAMDRLFRSNPALYSAMDERLRELGAG